MKGRNLADPCPVCCSDVTREFQRVDARAYLRCEVCAATFLDKSQLPSGAEELAQYRLHENSVDDPAYRRFLSHLADPLCKRLAADAKGLDYGCGPGPALAAMLEEAGHPMALYDPFFETDESVLARKYDFIVVTEAAEHFHNPAMEFDHLDDLLAPGGWLGVMTMFQDDDAAFAKWHYRADPTHVVFYRQETFRVIAEQRGWSCEFPRKDVALLRKNTPGVLGQ